MFMMLNIMPAHMVLPPPHVDQISLPLVLVLNEKCFMGGYYPDCVSQPGGDSDKQFSLQ